MTFPMATCLYMTFGQEQAEQQAKLDAQSDMATFSVEFSLCARHNKFFHVCKIIPFPFLISHIDFWFFHILLET